jgi:extracellular factor (EF) 3-hydroxypalmitic acid methyl ester biosynthesis protein
LKGEIPMGMKRGNQTGVGGELLNDYEQTKYLCESVNKFLKLDKLISLRNESLNYQLVVSSIHELLLNILRCEINEVPKDKIVNIIKPVRDLHQQSPFLKRCQDWSRGYAGDFETIEYLCNVENKALEGTVAYYIEDYALKCLVAQQHRNKVRHQANLIQETILKKSDQTNILSIASGSNRDLSLISDYLAAEPVTLVLNDIEEEALEFSQSRLKSLAEKCHYVPGNVFRKINRLKKIGPYDLVMIGGLFDYLTDKQIVFLLKQIADELLAEKGKIFFTNISSKNPYKAWMEYLANWVLIERTETDIVNLLGGVDSLQNKTIKIQRDQTGLTLLVEID